MKGMKLQQSVPLKSSSHPLNKKPSTRAKPKSIITCAVSTTVCSSRQPKDPSRWLGTRVQISYTSAGHVNAHPWFYVTFASLNRWFLALMPYIIIFARFTDIWKRKKIDVKNKNVIDFFYINFIAS